MKLYRFLKRVPMSNGYGESYVPIHIMVETIESIEPSDELDEHSLVTLTPTGNQHTVKGFVNDVVSKMVQDIKGEVL